MIHSIERDLAIWETKLITLNGWSISWSSLDIDMFCQPKAKWKISELPSIDRWVDTTAGNGSEEDNMRIYIMFYWVNWHYKYKIMYIRWIPNYQAFLNHNFSMCLCFIMESEVSEKIFIPINCASIFRYAVLPLCFISFQFFAFHI